MVLPFQAAILSATAFNPAVLFANGEQGALYDSSDISAMFQDSAGTTPVTAVEQPVGRILDKSGRGNHATQATAASRPVLSARVNLLTYTEQFDNAIWVKSGTTVVANAVNAPNGTATASKLVETAAASIHVLPQSLTFTGAYKTSFYAKSAERSAVLLRLFIAGGNWVTATYNLSSGTVSQQSSGASSTFTGVSSTIKSYGDGWYLCTLTAAGTGIVNTCIAIATSPAPTLNANSGVENYTGDGASGVYIWGADLRVANDGVGLPPYQRVVTGTTNDYDTSGFPLYLKFDGVDDSLATGTITPTTDKAQIIAGIRKASDAAQGVVAELSASIAANNGAFALTAPNSAAANYNFSSKGTTQTDNTVTTYTAPITNVVSGLADIAGTSNLIRVNGTQVGSVLTTQGTGNFLAGALNIGRRGGATLPFNGNLYGLIVRFSASNLDAATISSAETWMNGKTGAY